MSEIAQNNRQLSGCPAPTQLTCRGSGAPAGASGQPDPSATAAAILVAHGRGGEAAWLPAAAPCCPPPNPGIASADVSRVTARSKAPCAHTALGHPWQAPAGAVRLGRVTAGAVTGEGASPRRVAVRGIRPQRWGPWWGGLPISWSDCCRTDLVPGWAWGVGSAGHTLGQAGS